MLISSGGFSRRFVPSHTEELLCIYGISYSFKVVFFHATRYMLAYHVLQAERMESSIGRNGEVAKRDRDDAMLPSVYPVHVSASEVVKSLRC